MEKDYKNYTQTPEEFNNIPSEFSSDFIVETDNYADTTEMPNVPEEFCNEQAATTDRNDISELYVPNEYDSENAEEFDNYDVESADDYDNAYDRELDNDSDFYRDSINNYVDPSDEQAAVWDECGDAVNRCKLDDYEIISDVLGAEKQIVKLYSTALCEAAEDNFRNVIKENLDYAAEDQYKAFEFMSERGMYKTEQASEADITDTKKQFSNIGDSCCGCNPDYEHCNNSECGIDYDNCNCVDCSCHDDND